ncbi:MAG: response regulator transcription factor [Elusimicrobia bacterium]|nr:response regulator transcription factor [Elusimicrobiota bacterium]
MPRLLIVEDDPKLVAAIEKTVSLGRGFMVESVGRADLALSAALKFKPDIILLDVKLPGGDGRMVLKSLKDNAATRAIPVIFLTGMASEGDKVLGLNLGADDYVVKPFGAMELLARIQAVERRYRREPAPGRRAAGTLRLDPDNHIVTLGGKPLKLQPKEFEILNLLMSQPGRALSRTYLIENSSSYGLPISTRSLDTHIKNLRKKLGVTGRLIETVPKLGYRFVRQNA